MRLRSVVPLLGVALLCATSAVAQTGGVARTIDEGVFVVTRAGAAPRTESFKIVQLDNGLIRATSQLVDGDDRISSFLSTDSLGTPMGYGFIAKSKGATTLDVRAQPRGRRLAITSSDNHSNESMKEMPIAPGQSVILDGELVNQLYFVGLGKRSGAVGVIDPRTARQETYSLEGKGLEPLQIGRRSVTATHYSLTGAGGRRDFWLDANGRLLKVEIPASGLTAVRDELPK